MLSIEFKENLDEELDEKISIEFKKYADKNGIARNYMPFAFVAEDDDKLVGVITGNAYYNEVYIGELIVDENYRGQHVGSKLLNAVEDYYKDKNFGSMNLASYAFQAPEFYKKHGFELEFIREDKTNPKLTKYFFIKYF